MCISCNSIPIIRHITTRDCTSFERLLVCRSVMSVAELPGTQQLHACRQANIIPNQSTSLEAARRKRIICLKSIHEENYMYPIILVPVHSPLTSAKFELFGSFWASSIHSSVSPQFHWILVTMPTSVSLQPRMHIGSGNAKTFNM